VTPGGQCTSADVGREAAYAAEEAAFGGTDFDAQRAFAELVAMASSLTTGSWWQACAGPPVELDRARAGAASSSARPSNRQRVLVRLAAGQLSAVTVAHELGHALAGVSGGHGERFRAAHVDVVAVLAGRTLAEALRRCYADHGVPPGPRAWPPPHRISGPGFVIVP